MATYNNIDLMPVEVRVTGGVAAALPGRFVQFQATNGAEREVITYVPGANGGYPDGILAEEVVTSQGDGLFTSSIAVPDFTYPKVLLGEAVTPGAYIRAGGNGGEVDGAAYLADASGDFRIGRALEAGAAGEVVQIQFGFRGTTP